MHNCYKKKVNPRKPYQNNQPYDNHMIFNFVQSIFNLGNGKMTLLDNNSLIDSELFTIRIAYLLSSKRDYWRS